MRLRGVERSLVGLRGWRAGRSRLGGPGVAGCYALGFFVLLHGALHPVEELLRGKDAGVVLPCG